MKVLMFFLPELQYLSEYPLQTCGNMEQLKTNLFLEYLIFKWKYRSGVMASGSILG